MDVTVKSVVTGEIEYIFVSRRHKSIVRLDGVKSAWPNVDDCR